MLASLFVLTVCVCRDVDFLNVIQSEKPNLKKNRIFANANCILTDLTNLLAL